MGMSSGAGKKVDSEQCNGHLFTASREWMLKMDLSKTALLLLPSSLLLARHPGHCSEAQTHVGSRSILGNHER